MGFIGRLTGGYRGCQGVKLCQAYIGKTGTRPHGSFLDEIGDPNIDS